MNQEVEIQLKINDPVATEKEILKFGVFVKERSQSDQYYVLPSRDFFAVEPPIEYLRVRREKDKNHLNYSFLHFRDDGWLDCTDEYESIVENPEMIEQIFDKIGLISKVKVVKSRKYFKCGDFEVTLDRIENLGDFMEVEAKKDFGGIGATRKACEDFLNKLNIKYELNKDAGYPRMLYKKIYNKNNKL
jgi:adenylate cyclase, class 2